MARPDPNLPKWFRPRRHPHFDKPIGFERTRKLVENPARVASHAFMPFIAWKQEELRYRPEERRTRPKPRPIACASHQDSHIFSYYSCILSELYEHTLRELGIDSCVLAYRRITDGRTGRGKCNIHFAKEVFDAIGRMGDCSVIALDVEGFFDNIRHTELKSAWTELLGATRLPDDHYAVYNAVTRFAEVQRPDLYAIMGIGKRRARKLRGPICTPSQFRNRIRAAGIIEPNKSGKRIPQGSPISAVLSNIYLLDFDTHMAEQVAACGGVYRRYSDDILVVCPHSRRCCEQVASQFLQSVGLSLSPKSAFSTVRVGWDGHPVADKPVQYLGFVFDGERASVRHRSIARFQRRMKRGVRFSQHADKRTWSTGTRPVSRRGLYARFTHLGGRFPNYIRRSSDIFGSERMRRLNKRLWWQFHRLLWRK